MSWNLRWTAACNNFSRIFQSGVRRNGQVVQGYPSIIEAREEHEDDEEDEEEDRAPSVSPSSERNRAVNLRDASARSLLSGPGQRTTVQSSRSSRTKIQEITLTTLDPSNLSPRWVRSPLICLSTCVCFGHSSAQSLSCKTWSEAKVRNNICSRCLLY